MKILKIIVRTGIMNSEKYFFDVKIKIEKI